MDGWYSQELGDGMTAGLPAEEIKQAFEQVYQQAGEPPEMAIFTRLESEGRLHCAVIAYFSPAAGPVARAFEAKRCGKPAWLGLDLLAGKAQAWAALFPEKV